MSTWTKRYDSILSDPGYWALSSDAYRVLDHMTAWCNTQLTDGVFDTSAVAMTCSMLDDDEQKAAVDELEQAGFITADGDGFVISAYGHEQQTASEIEQKRKQGRARSKRHYTKHSVKNQGEEGSNASVTLPDTDTDTDTDSRLLDESGSASEDEEPCEPCIESEIESRYQATALTIRSPTAWKKTLRTDPDVIKAAAEACTIHRLKTRHLDCDRCRGSAFSNGSECPGPLTVDELADQRAEIESRAAVLEATGDKHGALANPRSGICYRCNHPAEDSTVHITSEEADALERSEATPW